MRAFLDIWFFEFSQAFKRRVFFSVVCERYVAAKTESAPAAAPPSPVVKICGIDKAAAPAAAIIPRTLNIPSMDPKTSSATRLPDSRPMSSVVWIARTSQPTRGYDKIREECMA
jgi:hypothetical protein